ncbi:hypothetical protein [Streptomyces sp. NPDC097619]|uniref:hypothetical protein n=1 Tax=Streptomyces sp. NPDC097619 TaxID=3157228 RepID=UPI00331B2346
MGPLVRAELTGTDWASLACGCGRSAEHLPGRFEAILTAGTPRDMIGRTLEGHVENSTVAFPCTPPAVGVIMAALAEPISPLARQVLLQTLWYVAAGAGDEDPRPGMAGIGEACADRVREGLGALVRAGLGGTADEATMVADICEDLGLDEDAVEGEDESYVVRLRERARAKAKRDGRG